MSETEVWKGKLTIIEDIPEGLEILEEIKFLQSRGYHFEDLQEDGWYWMKESDCMIINEKWYKVECEQQDHCEDLRISSKNDDGSYDFLVSYYNGCCSLDDALSELEGVR